MLGFNPNKGWGVYLTEEEEVGNWGKVGMDRINPRRGGGHFNDNIND